MTRSRTAALSIAAVAVIGGIVLLPLLAPSHLGPRDGFDLPPTDLDRVQAGDVAPDFTLEALGGEVVTLSDYRGRSNVVLVFYRGHW